MLAPLGLGPAEEQIYRLLVARRAARPPELASASGLSADQVEAALSALCAQGLASTGDGADPVYVPAPPAVSLGARLRERQDDLRRVELDVAALVEAYRSSDAAADVIEVITDVETVRRRFFQIQEGARREVRSMVVPNLTVVPHRQNTAELAGMARGIRYRVLLDRLCLAIPDMSTDIKDSLTRGQEIRVADSVPVKMMIVDGETALLPLHNDRPEQPASILVHRSGLLAVLIAFFEAEWARAYPLRTNHAGDVAELHPEALDDVDRQVLALLLSGLTDQALATQLQMSLRTVHRRIRQLMDKAGVDSRIQLGWAAARNDWA
jgi:sugar-specific transcriptional regulator TrmB/DNA-binding CsgD family transcriptional regulator